MPDDALPRLHTLPAQPTPLVGRRGELDVVGGWLRQPGVRLLTLTGPPGIGKTRLAVEAAGELLAAFPDGAVFVDLAPITDPRMVTPTIARTLGLREAPDEPPLERVRQYLHDKQVLLVLDNFEQVAAAARDAA